MLCDDDLGGIDWGEVQDMLEEERRARGDEDITDMSDGFLEPPYLDQMSSDATNQNLYESGLITPQDL